MSWGKLPTAIFLGSIAMMFWIAYELGLVGFIRVDASDEIPSKTPSKQASKESDESGLDSLHRSLESRQKELSDKEADLMRRERQVADKEAMFSQQLDRYEKIIGELKTRVSYLEALNQSKVETFKKLYEKMDPKKVARILETTEMALAAEIIGDMKPQLAAEILGKMSIEKVRTLTEKFLSKRMPASKSQSPKLREP